MGSQPPLVSVVIPCYNAQRWVAEAVKSCLKQTYNPIEIIVVDDGSTDGSLAALQEFAAEVKLYGGPNRGGNFARNKGFALSSGDYIQFLDADDYLLPDKIENQVRCLEETGADIVYSDWRHEHHLPDGTSSLDDVVVSGAQADIVESLLYGWWVAPVALLFRREAVEKGGGWDETLRAAQDRDFFLSVSLSGADVRYQPGCHSIYRRYGSVTVSTSDTGRWLDNHVRVLSKAENFLTAANIMSEPYRQALAHSFFSIARNYYAIDRALYKKYRDKAFQVCPTFKPQVSRVYNGVRRLCGFAVAERLAWLKRAGLGLLVR